MSARELMSMLADADGNLNLSDAVIALRAAIGRETAEGKALTAQAALRIFSRQLDHVSRTLAEALLNTQASVIAAHAAIQHMMTGQDMERPSFDPEAELELLLSAFEIERLAMTYDTLLEGSSDAGQGTSEVRQDVAVAEVAEG